VGGDHFVGDLPYARRLLGESQQGLALGFGGDETPKVDDTELTITVLLPKPIWECSDSRMNTPSRMRPAQPTHLARNRSSSCPRSAA